MVLRVRPWVCLIAVYVLVAASSFSGYFAKWGFRDSDKRFSFVSILREEAGRPFVYRQLIPRLSQTIASLVPARLRAQMLAGLDKYRPLSSTYGRALDADSGQYILQYYVGYLLCFSFWLLAICALAQVCRDAGGGLIASLTAPLIFAELYPILLARGGYFYDPVEMFFLACSVLLATRGRILLLILLVPFATLNKESFLFWIPCLLPLLPGSMSKVSRMAGLAIAVVISGLTYLLIRAAYAGNPGGAVEFHLLDNIHFYLTPGSYLEFDFTYGLPWPRGISLLNVVLFSAIVSLGWPLLTSRWKYHLCIALAVNLPLFLLFCWRDELRNLSFLFITLTVLIGSALTRVHGALPKNALS